MDVNCGVCKQKFDRRSNSQDCNRCYKPVHRAKCAKLYTKPDTPNYKELICTNCKPEEVMLPLEDGSAASTKSDIKLLLDEIKGIKAIVEQRIEPLERRMDDMDDELLELKDISNKAISTANFNSEYSRRNNLEIHGIPFQAGEDVIDLVIKVASEIEVELNPDQIDVAHRLPTKSKAKPPPIICKFVNRWKKEAIMKARINKVITAKNLGFESSDLRVFINENLTPEKRILAMETRRFFNNKGCTVWTSNGNIIVAKKLSKEERSKLSPNDPHAKKYYIESTEEFETVAEQLGLDDTGSKEDNY
ncbi:uncharacterized protein LOC127750851 [Frankliniella occidentalis]|uniref:Uncharacterized protein LOC127750851 n=1 Tax=Frankliniella occidentalis TaxID=133901 RepID=A0A9C6X588_FRAOC|nr:uncharacterized protein LOC127750851 [Frankliniella occidentalis]